VSALAALGVFAALACNLILDFGLGIRVLAQKEEGYRKGRFLCAVYLLEGGLIFLSVLVLWLVFTYVLGPLRLGLFRFILIFPLSAPFCTALDALFKRFLPPKWGWSPVFGTLSACEGLVPVALLLTLYTATGFLDAVALAFCFVLGILFPALVLEEIRRRAAFEAIPRYLRGSPLALITLGIVSLVSAAVAVLFFTALGL
jgi:electron transport complex protein RnfA